jgi:Ca2+/Na+ antiporter
VLERLRREWPFSLVLAVVVVGLLVVASGHFRRGCVVVSFGVVLALFLRVLLPSADAGMLAVRSKKVDVVVLTVLAVGTSVLSLWVPPPSQ